MADEWQTQEFRQTVIARITDILQSTGQDVRNATAMENQFFRKSRSKQEYLSSVAKLFMHFKDMQRGRPQQPPQPNPDMQQQNMAQDPLNALQNLASQGNRPQMMSMQNAPVGPVPASNLLQTLNQQRPGQQQMQQQMQGIRVQMPGGGGGVGVVGGPGGPAGVGGPNGNDASGPGGPQQMPGNMGNAAGGSGGNAQQMSGGMPGQMNQMQANAPGGGGGSGPVGMAPNAQAGPGVSGPGGGGSGPMQQNAGGGPMNVNAMNVQQMQQMNQNQMGMNMNHPQMNQMMNARMPVGGPNASPQIMQGMQQNSSGPMQANNVPGNATGGGPQAQLVGMPNANNSQPNAPNQMLNMPGNIQQRPNTPLQQGGQMFAGNRGIVGQQAFLRQSPSPSAAGAAAQQQQQQQQQQLAQQQQAQQQQQQQQQQQIVPPNQQQSQGPQLPTPQMIPSPALVPSSSPQMSNLMQNQQQRNIRQQSPSANLNTPGQVSQNSPFNPHEDQLYREKYKQLTKYIEPLKRMVAKIGNDDAEKITKMSKLLQILCNPSERVPLETLLKCEKALEKMEPCLFSGQQFKSSNPLMEAINTTIQSPVCNHTLYRTFRPSLEMLFGTNISAPPPPAKIPRRTEESTTSQLKIPHVLQGEVARLDARFKITLDTGAKNNQKSIKIICCLEDRRLPSVPPITVNIPEEYPFSSPDCTVAEKDYARTAFLKMVYNTLMARIAKLPKLHSLSHLLDTWEMSVRQSCSPNARAECDFSSVYTAAVF